MWQRLKEAIKAFFSAPETPGLTQVLVSTWYLGIGIMLAVMSKSLVFLLIFALPATIWWLVSYAHFLVQPTTLQPVT